jgi:hypothetical protein
MPRPTQRRMARTPKASDNVEAQAEVPADSTVASTTEAVALYPAPTRPNKTTLILDLLAAKRAQPWPN